MSVCTRGTSKRTARDRTGTCPRPGLRETGQAHEVLGDALLGQGESEAAVLEYSIAVKLFYEAPAHRKNIVTKALRLTDMLEDPALAEAIHIAAKMADTYYDEMLLQQGA